MPTARYVIRKLLLTTNSSHNFQGQGARFNVPDIRKLVECVSRGVLGARDPRVTEQLHIDGTKHWPRLYEAFLEKSLRMVEQALLKSVETAFEPWRSTRLVREIESIVKIFLNNTWREQSNFITLLWDMEKNKVMTGNSAMINHFEHEYREGLQKRSINCRADNLMRKLQREQPKPGNSSKSNTQKLPDINKLRESIKGKPDPYSTEIDLMAVRRRLPYMQAPSLNCNTDIASLLPMFSLSFRRQRRSGYTGSMLFEMHQRASPGSQTWTLL